MRADYRGMQTSERRKSLSPASARDLTLGGTYEQRVAVRELQSLLEKGLRERLRRGHARVA